MRYSAMIAHLILGSHPESLGPMPECRAVAAGCPRTSTALIALQNVEVGELP